ncbi:uncharacterized protein LOC143932933 [Lithobates pipiens]
MNKIFVFLILSCLVITGQLTTTCNQCWNIGSTKCCDERKFQCDGSDCMTSSEYCRINDVDFRTIQKGCSYEQLCDKCFSVTTKDNFVTRVSNVCGKGDGSNAKLNYCTNICDRQLQPNGYQCPSCFIGGNTDGCESTGYVDCLGLEKECVDYGATVILSGPMTPLFANPEFIPALKDSTFLKWNMEEHERIIQILNDGNMPTFQELG